MTKKYYLRLKKYLRSGQKKKESYINKTPIIGCFVGSKRQNPIVQTQFTQKDIDEMSKVNDMSKYKQIPVKDEDDE